MKLIFIFSIAVFVIMFIGILKSKNETKKLKEIGIYPNSSSANVEDVNRLLRKGYKIQAIKLYREINNVGLKEAKDKVEEIQRDLNL